MYVHIWKNIIVVHNTKKQGFTYQKSLWMPVIYSCQHLSMLHMWFCKICTFVKLDNENAVSLKNIYSIDISVKLHVGLLQYCHVAENSSVFNLTFLPKKNNKEQAYIIITLSVFLSHFELLQQMTDISQISVWISWYLKQN